MTGLETCVKAPNMNVEAGRKSNEKTVGQVALGSKRYGAGPAQQWWRGGIKGCRVAGVVFTHPPVLSSPPSPSLPPISTSL